MHRTPAVLLVLILSSLGLGMGESLGQSPPVPVMTHYEATSRDLDLDSMPSHLAVMYRVRDSRFPIAQCSAEYRLANERVPFPLLPISNQEQPDTAGAWRAAKVSRPPAGAAVTSLSYSTTWLDADGRFAYRVTTVDKKYRERFRPDGRKSEDLPPSLRLRIPMGAVGHDDQQTGNSTGVNCTVSITITCGSVTKTLPPGNIDYNPTTGELKYHFGGLGLADGQTCLVCVTIENPSGSVTICYFITFR